jgi:hypothetical protein
MAADHQDWLRAAGKITSASLMGDLVAALDAQQSAQADLVQEIDQMFEAQPRRGYQLRAEALFQRIRTVLTGD